MSGAGKWYEIDNPGQVVSPSLLVFPDRIKKNIEAMIAMAGDVRALRPHIKTHKIAEIVQLHLDHGITRFKCATITEAGLLADCGAPDILLAMQPVGINVKRFFELIARYPHSKFSTIVDNHESISEIARLGLKNGLTVPLWLDINNGMNRTGVRPNQKAIELYKAIVNKPGLRAEGLHVYDGHIHESDVPAREQACNKSFELVSKLKEDILECGIEIEMIIAGGTPTFPFHIKRNNVEVSPGTHALWDQGYSESYPDLPFIPAAVLLTRVISRPEQHLACFDLGHKSVASEMKFPRVKFLDSTIGEQVAQSEEHLIVECGESELKTGEVRYALPVHICPTVVKYAAVKTVTDGQITGSWKVAARDH